MLVVVQVLRAARGGGWVTGWTRNWRCSVEHSQAVPLITSAQRRMRGKQLYSRRHRTSQRPGPPLQCGAHAGGACVLQAVRGGVGALVVLRPLARQVKGGPEGVLVPCMAAQPARRVSAWGWVCTNACVGAAKEDLPMGLRVCICPCVGAAKEGHPMPWVRGKYSGEGCDGFP